MVRMKGKGKGKEEKRKKAKDKPETSYVGLLLVKMVEETK
jgi:hypothetical protein